MGETRDDQDKKEEEEEEDKRTRHVKLESGIVGVCDSKLWDVSCNKYEWVSFKSRSTI